MATLGSIHHDFPRLAEQSGFYFQLSTGRVNWTDIENLNLNEIIEKRNFQLLEENLIHVINCDLEREYDLKILDVNFVKLFKLAQLGVDYLSYCQMYLDRCVVLLQEQLTSFQEEYAVLKDENQKKKEELNKSKRKHKTQSYQCEKCEKVFISDVYLKYHDKRRHSNQNTPISSGTSHKTSTDNWQQTEDERKLSASTQTVYLNNVSTDSQECENKNSDNIQQSVKIEKLEQELKELKERLLKAENSLTERTEVFQSNHSNGFHSLKVPSSMCYNPMLMLLPSCLNQSGSGHYEINPGCSISVSVPEVHKPRGSESPPALNTEVDERQAQSQQLSQINTNFEKELEKQIELSKDEETRSEKIVENPESFQDFQSASTQILECDKENVDPNIKKIGLSNLIKPLPPPRKLKKGARTQALAVNQMLVERAFTSDINQEKESLDINSSPIIYRSTPIKKSFEEFDSEILEESTVKSNEINQSETNSTDGLNKNNSVLIDNESKSFIKKVIKRNTPKLRKFSKNVKRSLTNLYGSVSSIEKDSKEKECTEQYQRAAVVSQLNNSLKELGVDPEWQGIPKKTMKQKLNILKYRRKRFSKENPTYPVVRQNIEEKIFSKLKNNFEKKKETFLTKLSQPSRDTEDPPELENKSELVKMKNSSMYDINTDSQSDSESNFIQEEQNGAEKSVLYDDYKAEQNTNEDQEFDFTVFQVGGKNLSSLTDDTRKKQFSNNKEELIEDSEIECSFSQQSDEKLFKHLKSCFQSKDSDQPKDECKETPKIFENGGHHLEFSYLEKAKQQSPIILEESTRFQLNPSTNLKKQVSFAKYSDDIEKDLSDSSSEDDLWPFKSD